MGSPLMADGSWRIERRIRYDNAHRVRDGVPQFGFHVGRDLFIVEYGQGYIGLIRQGSVHWTAGGQDPGLAEHHVQVPLQEPRFVGEAPTPGFVLVTDARRLWLVDVDHAEFTILAESSDIGLVDPGNAIWLAGSGIWLNDIIGHQILQLTADGRLIRQLGDGTAGFQPGTVGFDAARFGHIYDVRSGPDGRLVVLDSTNYAVRVVDPLTEQVETICGDGEPGWQGDGGPAGDARLGGDPDADFDGPWSLVVDNDGTIYIGDTHNHAVRRVAAGTSRISTIAHSGMTPPSPPAAEGRNPGEPQLFTLICGMDLDRDNRRLLVPDWVSDDEDELIVLVPVDRAPIH